MMTASFQRNPIALLRWQRGKIAFYLAMGTVAWVLIGLFGLEFLVLPAIPISVIGAAIGIFTSFRANQSYDRWWEGRKLWGRMINASRHFGDQCLRYLGPEDRPLAEALVLRHIAYVHTLRCLLRKEDPWKDAHFRRNVADEDGWLEGSTNLTHALLDEQLKALTELADAGRLDERRLQSFDATLMNLLDIQGGCERIKGTPLPRGYGFMAELMVEVFAVLLPFTLVPELGLLAIPMNALVCLAFTMISEAGRVLEDPFTLFFNGLPLGNLSVKIERNLRERMGHELPRPITEIPPGVLY